MAKWIDTRSRLPRTHRLVLALLEGKETIDGIEYRRLGVALMIRFVHSSYKIVYDKWCRDLYMKALKNIGADTLEVTHWMYVPRLPMPRYIEKIIKKEE